MYIIFNKSRSSTLLCSFINLLLKYSKSDNSVKVIQGWLLKCIVNILQRIDTEDRMKVETMNKIVKLCNIYLIENIQDKDQDSCVAKVFERLIKSITKEKKYICK
jgi:hypothetical protein